MGDLREQIARALRDADEMQYPQMLTDEFVDVLADAVLRVIPEYEQVGWQVPSKGALTYYLWAGLLVPRRGFPEPVRPVFVERPRESGEGT